MSTLVGALGSDTAVLVDAMGSMRVRDANVQLSLWLSADENWSDPAIDPTTRQRLIDATPVVETRRRCGGGDVVQRAYGVAEKQGAVVVEVENSSPSAVAVAVVVEPVGGERIEVGDLGSGVRFGSRHHLWFPGPLRRWFVVGAEGMADALRRGDGTVGAVGTRVLAGTDRLVLLFAVAHGITWRSALGGPFEPALDPRSLPGPESVARGWISALDRAMRVEVPDTTLLDAIEAARAQALLGARWSGRHDWELAVTLEDWGFDDEAARVWARLGYRARRKARRRIPMPDAWGATRGTATSPHGDSGLRLLRAVREVLVDDRRDDEVVVLPGMPPDWLGAPVAVHDAPSRTGPVSFALRWHGDRPALLWDVSDAVRLRAPKLDPDFEGAGGRGEALLAPAPEALLRLQTSPDRTGDAIEDPGSFI